MYCFSQLCGLSGLSVWPVCLACHNPSCLGLLMWPRSAGRPAAGWARQALLTGGLRFPAGLWPFWRVSGHEKRPGESVAVGAAWPLKAWTLTPRRHGSCIRQVAGSHGPAQTQKERRGSSWCQERQLSWQKAAETGGVAAIFGNDLPHLIPAVFLLSSLPVH